MTFSPETTRAWVDVDLAALVANARTVAAVSGSRLLPMVKANGYGLGATEVARALEALDPWGFGVASVDEAQPLRASGITRPILVMTPLQPQAIGQYLDLDLRPSIGDVPALEGWIARGSKPFHLEIDTGMSRAGVRWDDRASLSRLATLLSGAKGWEGAFTHFLAAESDLDGTRRQWDRFHEVLRVLPGRPPLIHASNSAGALRGKLFAGDLVRPGIYLYGGAAGSQSPKGGRGVPGPGRGGPRDCRRRHGRVRSDLARGAPDKGGHGRGRLRGRISPCQSCYRTLSVSTPHRVERQDGAAGRASHDGHVYGRSRRGRGSGRRGDGVRRTDLARPAGRSSGHDLLRALDPAWPPSRTPLREVAVNPHFASLILGLSHQAEAALSGELPPGAEGIGSARQLAQTLIDTLGMLADKTSDRLDPDEKQLLDQALTGLRFRFVQTMPKP